MTSENKDAIEHQNVPAEHRSLHDFLYSAADEHTAAEAEVLGPAPTGNTPLSVTDWCEQTQGAKVTGVYTVLDCDRQPQFIGISRHVALSLRSHLTQKGEALCAFVTVEPFKFPKREVMAALRDDWIAALPSPPPGNIDGTWAGTIREAATQVMSAAERDAYEEKKLKLRRAMGQNSPPPDQSLAQADSPSKSQADLTAAMTDDNWSALIRDQTQETQP